MTKGKHWTIWVMAVVGGLVVVAALGYRYGRRAGLTHAPADATSGAKGGPVASVHVVTLSKQEIKEMLVVYGTVVSALGKTETFSVPFESQVQSVLVTAGQVVDANTPLVAITPSPDTSLSLAQARSEQNSAQDSLELVERLLAMKLTTQQNLVTAQQKLQAAKLKVKSMEDRGIDGREVVRSTAKGLVSRIDVEPGQIVAAGTTLVGMIGQNQISVRLGIENEDMSSLRPGQTVELYPVNAPEKRAVQGNITLITQRINPQTRLVDVFVTPHDDAALMLNEYLEAKIVLASSQGFVVPRSAVLPQQGHYIVYTIKQGHAVRHVVNLGLETPTQVQVLAEGLQAGDEVVTVGNYELSDGMTVSVEHQP